MSWTEFILQNNALADNYKKLSGISYAMSNLQKDISPMDIFMKGTTFLSEDPLTKLHKQLRIPKIETGLPNWNIPKPWEDIHISNNLKNLATNSYNKRWDETLKRTNDFSKTFEKFSGFNDGFTKLPNWEDFFADLKASVAMDINAASEQETSEHINEINTSFDGTEDVFQKVIEKNVAFLRSFLKQFLSKEETKNFTTQLLQALIVQIIMSIMFPAASSINIHIGDTYQTFCPADSVDSSTEDKTSIYQEQLREQEHFVNTPAD